MKPVSVVITRPEGEAFAERVRSANFDVIQVPLFGLEENPLDDHGARILAHIQDYSWIVFSSRMAVRFFSELPAERRVTAAQIAVIGPATAVEVEKRLGRRVDFCARGEGAEIFSDQFLNEVAPGDRLLVLSNVERRGVIEKVARARGYACDVLELYRHVRRAPTVEARDALAAVSPHHQWWTFFSPSAFVYGCEEFPEWQRIECRPQMFSIGATTTSAITGAGFAVVGQAREASEDSLIESLKELRDRAT